MHSDFNHLNKEAISQLTDKNSNQYQRVMRFLSLLKDNFITVEYPQEVDGSLIGLSDYKLTITGGSDLAGFPMRIDINTSTRKKILDVKSIGLKAIKRKGMKIRKTIHGNTVSEFIAQLNLKVKSEGAQKLEDIFPKKEAVAK